MTDTTRDLIQRLTERRLLAHVALITEAHDLLDQPEPEGLTEWELLDLGNDVMGNPLPCDPDLLLAFARALIAADRARWGRPATEPETNGQT